MCIPHGDLGDLPVGVLAFEYNYTFPPLFFFSLSATDPLLDLEVRPAARVARGGEGESLLQPPAPRGCVLFCLWICVICFVSFLFFFSQATKGLEKGTGNCLCGKIEQMGLRSRMDRGTDGQMGEEAQGSKMTPGAWLGMSAAEHWRPGAEVAVEARCLGGHYPWAGIEVS